MGPTLASALAATASLVSLAFALSTLERWLVRRRPHEAAWSASLFMFAAGSIALLFATGLGWSEWSFRAFYLFGGILNVPFLALGTVYLLAGEAVGRRVAQALVIVAAFSTGVVLIAPLKAPIAARGFPAGKDHLGVLPRVLAGVGSGLAALVIIGGALWSAWRLVRARRAGGGAAAGRLAAANVLIALGTLIISAKALFSSLGDEETAFSAAVAAGILVIFIGFLLTNQAPVPAAADATSPEPAAIPADTGAPAHASAARDRDPATTAAG
ncbi:MAG: hypothetical protein JWN46_2484 [Acidimicrobiales bacterium]|nr:hypothetical protein [Acidimicrobiales bacterium]